MPGTPVYLQFVASALPCDMMLNGLYSDCIWSLFFETVGNLTNDCTGNRRQIAFCLISLWSIGSSSRNRVSFLGILSVGRDRHQSTWMWWNLSLKWKYIPFCSLGMTQCTIFTKSTTQNWYDEEVVTAIEASGDCCTITQLLKFPFERLNSGIWLHTDMLPL